MRRRLLACLLLIVLFPVVTAILTDIGRSHQGSGSDFIIARSGAYVFCIERDALLFLAHPGSPQSIGGLNLVYKYPNMSGNVASLWRGGNAEASNLMVTISTNLTRFDPTISSPIIRQILQSRMESGDFGQYSAFSTKVGRKIFENKEITISKPTISCYEQMPTCEILWLHDGVFATTVTVNQNLLLKADDIFKKVETVIDYSQSNACKMRSS